MGKMHTNPIVKRVVTALSVAAAVVAAIVWAPAWLFAPAFFALFLLAGFEYCQLVAKRRSLKSPAGLALAALGLAILAQAFTVLPYVAMSRGNLMMLYLIAIIKFSDMGGFALGMAFGKHKLCPSISPKKSWEGLFGSVLASSILSCLFIPITHYGVPKSIALGIAAALIGTFGDLVESKFKRWAGVKDSATFMPAGLGGFLDMFDSLLFAPALLVPFLG